VIGLARSTFYYRSTAKAVGLDDARLVALIHDIHDEFPGYGYRRVQRALAAMGHVVNHKRLKRVMPKHGWAAKRRPRSQKIADGADGLAAFPNLYRNCIPTTPDTVWVADITYIHIASGFAYLAAVLDACSRKVVGYAISRRIDTQLSLAALEAAVACRQPLPGTCIHHSDRGSQYVSARYRAALANYDLLGSMSAPANPYDNAQAESFMKTPKVEEVYLGAYETFADVAARLPVFIEDVYNAKRMHSALDYLSPNQYEQNLVQQAS